jgi:hypothetical protein
MASLMLVLGSNMSVAFIVSRLDKLVLREMTKLSVYA